jgi:hypothetical protein
MTVPVDLVGDLSWGLKAAWIAWGIWLAIQVVWRWRARVEVSPHEPVSRDWIVDRSPLGAALRPERIRVLAPPPEPPLLPALPSMPEPLSAPETTVSAVGDTVEPAAAPKRRRLRRRSPRSEIASVMPTEAVSPTP